MFRQASVSLLPVTCCVVFLLSNRSLAGPCQLDKLTAEDGSAFGASVAISDPWVVVGDLGDSSLCSSSGCGTITVFRREGTKWIRGPKLTGSHVGFSDVFGASVDIDGNVIVVGAPHSDPTGSDIGEAYVFRYNGSAWVQEARLIPSGSALDDKFGQSVAVSGDVVAVGAPRLNSFTGRVYVFRWNGTAWVEEASLIGTGTEANDQFGGAVALDGEVLVVGARGDDDACPSDPKCQSGAAYVFGFDGADWVQEGQLTASDKATGDLFGWSLDITGRTVVVGALDAASGGVRSGAAYLFEPVGFTWTERAKLVGSDSAAGDQFGSGTGVSQDVIVVGARRDDDAGHASGSAYVFRRDGSQWTETGKVIGGDVGVGALFGSSLALEAPYALVAGGAAVYTFSVPACIPTIMGWGFILLLLLMLVSGTLCLRARIARHAVVALFFLAADVSAQHADLTAPHHPERFLVRFKQTVSDETRSDIHATIGAERVKDYSRPAGLTLVRVTPDRLATALGDYSNRAEVLYAEPDYKRFPAAECMPDDPDAPGLWGMDRIRAPEAWCIETGETDLLVAVIDGGVWYPHLDMADNIWTNPGEIAGNGVDDDGNGYIDDVHGYAFTEGSDGDPLDDELDSHGTHVAGIVGAVGNNAIGVVGVNWSTSIVALKVLPADGLGDPFVSDVVAAINYVIDNGIRVSNNSYAGTGLSVSECAIIAEAGQEVGHLFIAAAGNTNKNIDENPVYPAACEVDNIITVAATDGSNQLYRVFEEVCDDCCHIVENGPCELERCIGDGCVGCGDCVFVVEKGSNYGPNHVHLSAPGVGIKSTIRDNGYGTKDGTSMAAPHVAGVAALMMSRYPDWTNLQIKERILDRVQPAAHDPGLTLTDGIVDAYAALIDCNDNGIDDDCDLDCGDPGGACDVPGCGQSFDCDANDIPDECEADCNGNGLRDTCDLASGTSEDCDGDAVPDECQDCDENGVIDHCDVDCTAMGGTCNVPGCGTKNDCNADCIRDLCQCSVLAPMAAPLPVPGGVPSNRYLGFIPANPGCRTALEVYIQVLPQEYGFDSFQQTAMWVDNPEEVCESSGETTPPCSLPGTFQAARLTCDPVYRDWSTTSPLYVYDDEIVASAGTDFWSKAVYSVRHKHQECGMVGHLDLTLTMPVWGDITGGWDGSAWTGPDGAADQSDIDAVVAKFQNQPGAPIKARADVAPDVPDRKVDFIDIGRVTNATQGHLYPYDGPTECPP